MEFKRVPLEILLGLDETRLQRSAIKLTHVGEQTEPILTIVMQTYYYLPSLEIFRSLLTPGLSYANDELPVILNFSVEPPEFKLLLDEAQQVRDSERDHAHSPSLSFSAVVETSEEVQGTEILFSHGAGVKLHRGLARALNPEHKIGQLVLQRQRESVYPAETRNG